MDEDELDFVNLSRQRQEDETEVDGEDDPPSEAEPPRIRPRYWLRSMGEVDPEQENDPTVTPLVNHNGEFQIFLPSLQGEPITFPGGLSDPVVLAEINRLTTGVIDLESDSEAERPRSRVRAKGPNGGRRYKGRGGRKGKKGKKRTTETEESREPSPSPSASPGAATSPQRETTTGLQDEE
jgi:hypothetical protein